jgi:hypothetical protein
VCWRRSSLHQEEQHRAEGGGEEGARDQDLHRDACAIAPARRAKVASELGRLLGGERRGSCRRAGGRFKGGSVMS